MIKVVDGDVQFATHEIKTKSKNYYAFDSTDLHRIESRLTDEGIFYKVAKASEPKEMKNKTLGVKYKSRSEALEHLENNQEPHNLKEKRLEKENSNLKSRVKRLENQLQEVLNKLNI